MPEWDAVVCGGGAAGLVLASELTDPAALARPGGPAGRPVRRVLVVDDGRTPLVGRSWAYWADRDTVVDQILDATWHRLRVHADGASRDLGPSAYSYRMVRGPELAALAERRAAQAGVHLERRHGTVESVATAPMTASEPAEAHVVVDGSTITASWAFDGRPPDEPRPGEPRMRFAGAEVETERDTFDPEVATFLDFRPREPGLVRFSYMLPLTRRRALVDVVTFGLVSPDGGARDPVDEDRALSRYLDGVLGVGERSVARRELDDIPLRREPERPARGRVVAIGRRGGQLRPSTGFALDRILRDSARIADSLRRHGHPYAGMASSTRHDRFDRIMLEVMAGEPDAVEPAFAALFARNPVDRVLRFLDGDTTRREEAAIVATLPRAPFLRAAARVATGGRGPGLAG